MNALEAAITFLSSISPGVVVSGEVDFSTGDSDVLCFVSLAGDASTPSLIGTESIIRYSLKFYGPNDDALLDAHKVVRDGTFVIPGIPVSNVEVRSPLRIDLSTKVLKWAQVLAAFGPLTEPDTDRRVLISSAVIKWAN